MRRLLIRGLKKSFICFLMISFTGTLFSSPGFAGYGISIDIEERNLTSPSIRILFLNIDQQKVEEVNYYSLLEVGHNYSYKIPINDQHPESPLIGFTFSKGALQEVIVKDSFSTDKYTVISKFYFRKANDSELLPFTSNEGRYYKRLDTPRAIDDLNNNNAPTNKKTSKEHKPTFRYFKPKKIEDRGIIFENNQKDFLEKALGGGSGEAKTYTQHKEKMGEYATLLTLLEYGYTQIHDSKQTNNSGMDFIASSGDDPSQDILLLVESKWTSVADGAKAYLDRQLNNNIIISRLKNLSQSREDEFTLAMSLVRGFFTTTNSKICKLFYRIVDKKDKNTSNRSRGVGKSASKALSEADRIEIGKTLGIIIPQVAAKDSSISAEKEYLYTLPPEDLPLFIKFLNEKNEDLARLSSFLKKQYAARYEEYFCMWVEPGLREIGAYLSATNAEEKKQDKEVLLNVTEIKDDNDALAENNSTSAEKEDNPSIK